MDLHKITHDAYEVTKHWHLPFLALMMGSFRACQNGSRSYVGNDYADAPGDNILPGDILSAFRKRKQEGAL